MDYSARFSSLLQKRMTFKYPDIFRAKESDLNHGDIAPDTRSLIEKPLEYDADVTADLVIRNARLGGGAEDSVRQIAISGNLITRVGTADEIEEIVGPNTKIIDACEHSVLPGFTDSHLHLSVAMKRRNACIVEDLEGVESFKKRIVEFAGEHADEAVLRVFGLHYFDDPIIPSKTCRHMLDELVDDKPLLVYAHDLHTVWSNSRALKEAELLHAMPPYPDLIKELDLEQKIILGDDGLPSGEFREPEVCCFISGPLDAKFPSTVERQLDDLEAVCQSLAEKGITCVHRMGLAQPAEDISFLLLLLELDQRGRLPIRVCTSFSALADNEMRADVVRAQKARNALAKARRHEIDAAELHDRLLELLKEAGGGRHEKLSQRMKAGGVSANLSGIHALSAYIRDLIHRTHIRQHTQRANPHREEDLPRHLNYHTKIRCDTVKIFMDGIIEKNTAFRLDKPPSEGIPEFQRPELNALLEMADKLGLQVAAHSIGDGSVNFMLDAIAKAREANREIDLARGHRIPQRIEHIEICTARDLLRFGKEDVVASMQPLHERAPFTLWHKLVPKREWSTAFAWKDLLQNGSGLVFGSDWPIVSCDVLAGIKHAVAREPWYAGARQQALDLEEALAAYTKAAAVTEYGSQIKGTIEPGMLADMVILSGSIDELPNKNQDLAPRCTICSGRVIFRAE